MEQGKIVIKKDVGSKLKAWSVTYGVMVLTLFNALYWQHEPQILQQDTISFKYLLANILHGFSVTGPVLAILLVGYLVAHSKTIGLAQIWGLLIIGSWSSLLVLCLLQETVWLGRFYNAVLPILRNTYPLVSGILLGVITLKFTKKLFTATKFSYYLFFIVAIVVPTIFNQDIFGYGGGVTLVYSWVIFTLGANIPTYLDKARASFYLVGSFLALIFFLGLMPIISEGSHNNLTTAARLTNPASLFPVLFSMCLLGFIVSKKSLKASKICIFSLVGVLLFSTTGDLVEITNELNSKSYFGLRYLELFEAVLVPLTIMGVVYVYSKLPMFKKMLELDNWFETWNLGNADKQMKSAAKATGRWMLRNKYKLLVSSVMLVLAYLSFVVTALDGRVAASMTGDFSFNAWTYAILQRPQMIILNALLFICLYLFLRGLVNNFWFAFLVSDYLIIIWLVATRLKIDSRREPILPSEASMIKAYGDLLQMVPSWILILSGCSMVALVLAIFWLSKIMPVERSTLKQRMGYVLIPCIVIFSSFYWNHENSIINKVMRGLGNDPQLQHQIYASQLNGPTIQFLNNLDVVIMNEPKDYSKAKIEEIVAKYSSKAEKINTERTNNLGEQTIIFNLSESFSDPSRVHGTKLKNDPIPYVHQLMKNNVSGNMISSGYGGGTANMEYMTLTGFPMVNFSPTISTPYAQITASKPYNPSIVNYFPNAVAIHPYVGDFYRRPTAYSKLGFNDFIYLGSKTGIKYQEKIGKSPYLSDRTAYKNTLEAIKNNKEVGQFINLVTMQNHMPYIDYYDDNTEFEVTEAVDIDNTRAAINNFSTGLNYTDKYLREFIEQIDQIQKPITLVFYGDHLPGIYANSMETDGVNLHETDYFIYSNKYAQAQGATVELKNTAVVSPNDFPAMVAEKTNSKISPYYALLTEVYQKTPAFYLSNSISNSKIRTIDYVTENEQVLNEDQLSAEQKEILKDLELIQYDVTTGKNYVKDTKFMHIP